MYPSSVVQTGVKSLGCENRIAQPSPIHSWKRIVPCVVSAVKSGASSFMRRDMVPLLHFLLSKTIWHTMEAFGGASGGTLVYFVPPSDVARSAKGGIKVWDRERGQGMGAAPTSSELRGRGGCPHALSPLPCPRL